MGRKITQAPAALPLLLRVCSILVAFLVWSNLAGAGEGFADESSLEDTTTGQENREFGRVVFVLRT
jgi:hypothetical protein